MKHEFSEKVIETYLPYWEEMKAEVKGVGYWITDTRWAKLRSRLNRAYMQALEVGFNEGWKFSLDRLMNIVDRSAFSVEVKELLRQMIEIQKTKIT